MHNVEKRMKEYFANSRVKFSSKIDVVDRGASVGLHIQESGKNMQTDENAFEAWALALRALGFETVELSWASPGPRQQKHYNRFLYRIVKFKEIFDWLKTDTVDANHIFAPEVNKYINHGIEMVQKVAPSDSECFYEEQLYTSCNFLEEHNIEAGHIARQLPVGVFTKNPPTDRSALFTGKKSAIDLYGIDRDGILKIFELKIAGNKKAGALSEVFFYWCILNDVRKKIILPVNDGRMRDSQLMWNDIISSKKVENYIISSGEIHPIVKGLCDKNKLGQFPLIYIENYQCS